MKHSRSPSSGPAAALGVRKIYHEEFDPEVFIKKLH